MKKLSIILAAVILAIAVAFLIRDYLKFRPADWEEGNAEQWEEEFPDDPAYEMAINADTGLHMFKDPMAAMKKFKTDYKEMLKEVQEEYTAEGYRMNDFTKYTYRQYMMYASNVPEIILDFCHTFENSFKQ